MKRRILFAFTLMTSVGMAQTIQVNSLGRFTDGRDAACEISTYDKMSKKLFVTNAAADSIDIVDISDATSPMRVGQIDVLSYGGGVNSVVSLNNGYLAAAIENNTKQNDGVVVFYDTAGNYVSEVTVGALPDMIAMTHDGEKLLVANEGEPSDDYLTDPKGSVSIIDISGSIAGIGQSEVTNLFFKNDSSEITGSLRKPGTTWDVDLEPEYIAVEEDDSKAFVICQEANVLIVVDLSNNSIESYNGLGFKDHSQTGNGMDASNKDQGINIKNWDVLGVYQPDAIASYSVGGNAYVVSANEGDGRDYSGYSSEARIKDLMLDTIVFPNAAFLQADSNLGRLKTFTSDVIGDADGDGYVEELYSYGARSFSIWDENGDLVYDSGDDFEQYIKDHHDSFFNCNDGLEEEMDDRSDDKGPEPEATVVGKIRDQYFAFIGLERQGGIMVYNVTNPNSPVFETFIEEFDEVAGNMTDIAPEGLLFIPASESHNSKNMLIVSNEVSGTVALYEIVDLYDGVAEVEKEVFKVYPNPTSDVVRIQNHQGFLGAQYMVINSLGNVVQRGRLSHEIDQVDLGDLPSGMYQISILEENGQNLASQRVMKIK